MRIRLFAAALAVCIPAAAFAQRGGGGGSSNADPAPPAGGSSMGAKSPSSRDLADLNPAALLVDKKKKASLADSTVARLKAVAKTIDARNARFFTTLSLIHI